MKTKIQLVSQAFDELRINGITSKAKNEDVDLALESLEQLVSELTFDIGWRFEDIPDPNSPTGIDKSAESAIYLSLAVRIADRYGKQISPMKADAAMSRLLSRAQKPRQVVYPDRMPMGLGNRRQYRYENQFMPQQIQAPNNVNTEYITYGDKVQLSIDFTNYIRPNETVSSYTKEFSQGIVISGDYLSGNTVTFTVEAKSVGYEYVMFKATGDAGTIINRRIDFNLNSTESARGNP